MAKKKPRTALGRAQKLQAEAIEKAMAEHIKRAGEVGLRVLLEVAECRTAAEAARVTAATRLCEIGKIITTGRKGEEGLTGTVKFEVVYVDKKQD